MAAELARHRRLCRRDHAGYRAAGRLQPGADERPDGETLGIGIFLTYLVPPTLLFLPLARIIADLGCRIRCGRWCWSTRPSRSRSVPGC